MADPLLLYLDQTGDGLPDEYGDGIYGEFDYGGGINPTDVGARTAIVTRGAGGNGFGSTGFGSGDREQINVSRVIRPQDRQALDYRRVRNGVGDWTVSIPGEFNLHDWIEADAFIIDESGVRFHGKVWDFEHSEESSVVTLSGPGPGGGLERGSAHTTVDSTPAWEAFEQYIGDHIPGWTVGIEEPDVNSVDENVLVQSVDGVREDLEEATSIDQTDPFHIVDGGIEPTQTCFTTEATETSTREIGDTADPTAGEVSNEHASNGTLVRLQEAGDRVEYTFEAEHTIPQARIGIRWAGVSSPTVRIGFEEIDEDAMTVASLGETAGLHWEDLRQFGESMRTIRGQTTVVIEVTRHDEGQVGGGFLIDVVAPRDLRYDVFFDNAGIQVGDETYLRGPEMYPAFVQLETDRVETEHNVTRADIRSDWPDKGRDQAVALSINDTNWSGLTQTANLNSFFNISFGYGVRARFTFSWADDDLVYDTPRQGREPQRIEGWEIYVYTNDLAVIEDEELTDDHMGNLQQLADRASLRFYVHPTDPHIEAFHEAQREDQLLLYDPELDIDADVLTTTYNDGVYGGGFYGGGFGTPQPGFRHDDIESSKSTGDGYANVVVVRGAHMDGERIEEIARDEREIEALSRFGRDSEAMYVRTDSSITTQTDAKSAAEELLTEMKAERDFGGSVTGLPREIMDEQPIHPGIEYFVDRWTLYTRLEEVFVDDDGVDLDFTEATADQIIRGIQTAQQRANSAHRAL